MTKLLALLLVAGVFVAIIEWSLWPLIVSFVWAYIMAGVLGKQRKRRENGRREDSGFD